MARKKFTSFSFDLNTNPSLGSAYIVKESLSKE
jgi:hypothetical protein